LSCAFFASGRARERELKEGAHVGTKRGLERLIAHLFGRVSSASSAPTKLICLIMSGGAVVPGDHVKCHFLSGVIISSSIQSISSHIVGLFSFSSCIVRHSCKSTHSYWMVAFSHHANTLFTRTACGITLMFCNGIFCLHFFLTNCRMLFPDIITHYLMM
jgi:hypothetical protein